jgi:exodeoxyribonuclease VII large subunit
LEFDFQVKLGLLSGNWVKKSINHLGHLEQKVELLRPENTLKRGFSITYSKNKSIQGINDVRKGDVIKTQLRNGTIESTILKIQKNDK